LIRGQSGIAPITLFDPSALDTRIAGEVKLFDATRWITARDVKSMDRFVQFAIAAGSLAFEDAGLVVPCACGRDRVGCYIGVSLGGTSLIERTVLSAAARGPRTSISPYFLQAILPNMAAGHVSRRFGMGGPVLCHAGACASGAQAIGEAMRTLQRGEADLMLAGGTEAPISLIAVGGFASMRVLSRRNDDPAAACRPFERDRDGFVIAEGAGMLLLEGLDHARKRDARVYCELAGYSTTNDAYHSTAPDPTGEGAARAMKLALQDAGLDARDVEYINAHGTGTSLNDVAETLAIKRAFGDAAFSTMVNSTKSMTGHMMGAAGGLEAAACALALTEGEIPPTINYREADPACDLDYVPNEARRRKVKAAMSNSFGFGGTNACLVLVKV
jgi:3-oxoacyl-[acyl-carrier-protein] synthase II